MAVDQGLIGNTSQFMVDETGKRVILDLSHCVCCDQTVEEICGECQDAIGNTVTVDLGTTAFTAANDGYYGDCETPCNDLTGEIVLTKTLDCKWLKIYDPFCVRQAWTSTMIEIYQTIGAQISWDPGLSAFVWIVSIVARLNDGPIDWYLRWVAYKVATGTDCTGVTVTLSKVIDLTNLNLYQYGFSEATFNPCKSGGDMEVWAFPATIDLIIP